MPLTASGLTFYDQHFETGVLQALTEITDIFNTSSGGALLLDAGAERGRNPKRTFFHSREDLIQTRDPSGSGSLVPRKLVNAEKGTVKRFYAAPLTFTRQDWIDQGMSEETGSRLFGAQFGQNLAIEYVNAAIAAAVGAIGAIGATAVHDQDGSALSHAILNTGLFKFGDRRQSLRTLVASSTPLLSLSNAPMTSQPIAYQVGGATIFNGSIATFGLPVVNVDSPSLWIDNPDPDPDNYWTLALVGGAVQVREGPLATAFSFLPGTASSTPENMSWLLSLEAEYEIEVRGVSWTGASNPSIAALADPSNWTQVTAASGVDAKAGPGVAIKTD